MLLSILLVVIFTTLVFEYINGMHDSANAIATVVSTKTLSPRAALLFGAILNIAGAFAGTHVAKTIGSGLVDSSSVTQIVIFCALIAAIIWNLITWYFGIPSSSSHALIGGLIGASFSKSGSDVIHIKSIMEKVIFPMITSPVLGFIVGFILMILLFWIFFRTHPQKVDSIFRKLQLLSSGFVAFSHGSNDAQKTMGIITLALFSYGALPSIEVPYWVILICAFCMGLGTMAGGWRIIKTLGSKVIKLQTINGFAAETSAAVVILTASFFGYPISTTHVISTSIMGVGSTKRFSAVKWGIVKRIITAWILTIPICITLAWFLFKFIGPFLDFP